MIQEEIEIVVLEMPKGKEKCKDKGKIRITTVLPLPAIVGLFGSVEGVNRYRSIGRDLKDIADKFGETHDSVLAAITASMRLRSKILEISSTRVMPIPVLRICITLDKDSDNVPRSASLQASSYYRIPIFLSKDVIEAHSFDIKSLDDNYGYAECHLGSMKGYYVDNTSFVGEEEITIGDHVRIMTQRNYLVIIKGDKTSMYGDRKDTIHKSFDGMYTIVYGSKKLVYTKAIESVEKHGGACVIHICNDFTLSDNDVIPSRGLQCGIKMLQSSPDESFIIVTGCAKNSVIGGNSSYRRLDVYEVGEVFIKNISH